ncbi:MAG: ferritin-like domain-containing protein [Acidobacteria bacterium]|jgi:ferritin-like metal-binding protein YciE|nr:ferritin-like domain-containing protein [Acidobacteriota bacterium]
MAIKTLEEKFQHGLGDIYDAEHRFLEAQQTMLQGATDATVQSMLEKHIAETQQQIVNLTRVYEVLGLKAERVSCDAAAGLVSEGNKLLKETKDVPALADLAINGSCSKVEHYEIASYRGLIAGAEMMGQTEVAQLLTENLDQEENTADSLEATMPALLERAMQTASKSAVS